MTQKYFELFILLKSKQIYLDFIEEFDVWKIPENENKKILFLQANYNDDIILFENNKYKLVHYTFNTESGNINNKAYVVLKEFSSPQEVWEQVIKPDIEDYYGIKIEE